MASKSAAALSVTWPLLSIVSRLASVPLRLQVLVSLASGSVALAV